MQDIQGDHSPVNHPMSTLRSQVTEEIASPHMMRRDFVSEANCHDICGTSKPDGDKISEDKNRNLNTASSHSDDTSNL